MPKLNIQRCTECGQEDSKYKCPTCRAAYCSTSCCQTHKEIHHNESLPASNFIIDTTPTVNENIEELSQDDRLALDGVSKLNKLFPADLLKLTKSEELKQLLANPHLKDYLSYINSLEYPRGFMKIAMQEPIFVEFADACLKAIHPEDYEPIEISDEQLVDKLKDKLIERAENDG